MSLGVEFFAQGDERDNRRDVEGVSLNEAEMDLSMYGSSTGPVAIETAKWMYKNWKVEQFFQLPELSRLTFLEIIEKEILPSQLDESEELPLENQEQIRAYFSAERYEKKIRRRESNANWYKVIKNQFFQKLQQQQNAKDGLNKS